MFDLKRSTHRRGFLGTIAAGTAAIGITALARPLKFTTEPKVSLPGSDDSEFEAWLGKIKGKHRQVFDAPSPNNGFPLAWSRIFLMTNKQVGVADDDITAVLVLRHDAIPLGMGHDLWAKYKFGEAFKVDDGATKAPAVRNPFYQPKEGELPLPGMAIEDLLKSNVLFGICDMALTFYSKHIFAPKMNMDADAIKKDWVAGILPGIQIVPSGVLAVNRAQEHHCTYCYAG
ncbi:MAG: twin-arginine translocation signal domain-containing protein [Ignavibacteria bacterium]|nr:twin-arginine translocation signal domain-containing protein [Ignavibacteria bacterium]MBI3764993.1 twin-arginine translocation signal domain-containing protein [Ignavibacteriales bacterium]